MVLVWAAVQGLADLATSSNHWTFSLDLGECQLDYYFHYHRLSFDLVVGHQEVSIVTHCYYFED